MGTRKSVSRATKSSSTSSEFMEKLKHFIRSSGPDYLRDNNISSIGIGYKRKEGKPTDQLSIQFTVAKKAAPEVLELLGSTEIPRSILIDGVEVPTDVIQRRYERAFKIVAESASDTRKTRIDPIVPGISVANKAETAGTLGCIVFDRQDETPYGRSVFEKLEISLKSPRSHAGTARGRGYDADFLGPRVDVPELSSAQRNDAFRLDGAEIVPYTHFSLAQSKSRRFAFWVAWNIDGGRLKRIGRNGLRFDFDPRIPDRFQVGDEVYANNRLDRGHIARRADLVWGREVEARQANKDSFFFTNITPQMDDFNQSHLGGIWGKLEDVDNLRVSAFGGPVFRDDDRLFRAVKIPREFFKVLAFVEAGRLKANAFLLTQNLDQLEVLDLNEFRVFQITLAEVEQRCGFSFPSTLRNADGFAEQLQRRPEFIAEREALQSLADITW
ncbi:MAG: DNA/RNA non-specific endonuclease [Gammaproteobacteria bacterium]